MYVSIGLGLSGLSVARYLYRENMKFTILDTRDTPPGIDECKIEMPEIEIYTGGFHEELLQRATTLVVSQGIDFNEPAIQACKARGVDVIGDVELFARVATQPIIAITGTNGKSTVTALVHEMAQQAGINSAIGGNFGVPVLDLLKDGEPDLYVLELSSFQLETTYSLTPKIAALLNITYDHMDRYKEFEDYVAAKKRIYENAEVVIYNADEPLTTPEALVKNQVAFAASIDHDAEFYLRQKNESFYLMRNDEKIIDAEEILIKGQHNWLNGLAACAIASYVNIPVDAIARALKIFPGLAHRCEFVSEQDGVVWYNDSKATNVSAAVAAINGLSLHNQGDMIVIVGGQAKDNEFGELKQPIKEHVKLLITLGDAREVIHEQLHDIVETQFADDLSHAVAIARERAKAGDIVLLAPACTSYDMFKNFEERGDVFKNLVTQ